MWRKFLLFCLLAIGGFTVYAQETVVISEIDGDIVDSEEIKEPEDLPVISYSLYNKDKRYTIAEIKVSGVERYGYQDYVLVGISGLAVGDKVEVPGEAITNAIRQYWKHGLFSDAKILANKLTADSVWLEIALKPNPLVSQINFEGVRKSEKEELETKIGVSRGSQLTPNVINRIKKRAKDYFEGKGFSSAEVKIQQRDDLSNEGHVILDISVDKYLKTKINRINIIGNEQIADYDLKVAMKKTNEKFDQQSNFLLSWRKMFATKKFVREEYEKDLENLLMKYNEKGYRDARVISEEVVPVDERQVEININIEEGQQYHIRDVKWVGNTIYHSNDLEFVLDMKKGDIYNQKKLTERLSTDEDAVSNLYHNRGYIFANLDPVEVNIEGDSIDLEIRVQEGIQATINRIIINGNDRLYEDIVRRELPTKPGQLFSKDLYMRSAREISQMGHFDPETMDIQLDPDPEAGTVDLVYNLTSKANDQIELSAGYGQTGIIGRVSLKFSNFSIKNLLNPKSYKGVIPQGEGQTFTVSGQTNGRYYQSYSISFLDPWFGGKRPNSLSVGAYYMRTTGVESRYYNNYYNNYYGYNSYGGNYQPTYDDNQRMEVIGASIGYGKRLKWPDDYFNFMAEIGFQKYILKNWQYFVLDNGNSNSLTLGLTLSRNSIDNPYYTRSGSQFTLSVHATPPYSLWNGVDYSKMEKTDPKMNEWVEYHKWKFKGKIFMPLAPTSVKRTPVLMSRIEYGFVGHYNSNKKSPFETFYMGGDGMSGYSSMYAQETVGLRGYENGSLTPYGSEAYAYSRLALELRYPILLEQSATVYALAFVEAGNAWTSIKEFNPFDLKRSAGVGVRVFLPMIGLLGLDWAYGFDSATPGSAVSGSRMHFVLGQEF